MPNKKITSLIALLVALIGFLGSSFGFDPGTTQQITAEIVGIVTGVFALIEIIRMNLPQKAPPTGTQRPK